MPGIARIFFLMSSIICRPAPRRLFYTVVLWILSYNHSIIRDGQAQDLRLALAVSDADSVAAASALPLWPQIFLLWR